MNLMKKHSFQNIYLKRSLHYWITKGHLSYSTKNVHFVISAILAVHAREIICFYSKEDHKTGDKDQCIEFRKKLDITNKIMEVKCGTYKAKRILGYKRRKNISVNDEGKPEYTDEVSQSYSNVRSFKKSDSQQGIPIDLQKNEWKGKVTKYSLKRT